MTWWLVLNDGSESVNDNNVASKQSTLEEEYNWILEESSIIKSNGEILFVMFRSFNVVIKELSEIYWTDKVIWYLKEFMSDKNEQDNNLFEFIQFIEPDKKRRQELYEKLLVEWEKNASLINDEEPLDGYYDMSSHQYANSVKQAVAEWQNLDTLIWKFSNFKHLFDFVFNGEMLEDFWFYEKLQELNWDVVKVMQELREVFVSERKEKLNERIIPLLSILDQKLVTLRKWFDQINSDLLDSVNETREGFNDSFPVSGVEEIDELMQSWIDALKQNIENLQKSADETRERIENDIKEMEEKRTSLLKIKQI